MTTSDYPIVAESDLDTLPIGVYLVAGADGRVQTKRVDSCYDVERDVFVTDVEVVLWARVRSPTHPIPTTADARTRPDGLVVLTAWQSGPA